MNIEKEEYEKLKELHRNLPPDIIGIPLTNRLTELMRKFGGLFGGGGTSVVSGIANISGTVAVGGNGANIIVSHAGGAGGYGGAGGQGIFQNAGNAGMGMAPISVTAQVPGNIMVGSSVQVPQVVVPAAGSAQVGGSITISNSTHAMPIIIYD